MSKSALIVRHVPYEGIAGYREPIESAGYVLDRIDVTDESFEDVDLSEPDLVIVMGGPMGVYDVEEHPWIPKEICALRRRLAADRPTLGICLGSQMMAAALGADVYRGHRQEIGFHPIALMPDGEDSPLVMIGDTPMLHWHGDTFDLPQGTEWLARTETYAHQAFRRGPNILALQFHGEMGVDPRIDAWIDHSTEPMRGLGLCPVRMRHDYNRIGPDAMQAGQRMIADWINGIGAQG